MKIGGNFKINSTFSNIYLQCQIKIMQALEMFPWYLQYVHTEAGFIHCYTPSPRWGTGSGGGGGICNPGACAEFHIHIHDTSPDSDILIYQLTAIGLSPSGSSTEWHKTNNT